MMPESGRIRPRDALCMVFRFRARTAKLRGNDNSIDAAIAKNLSLNGGSVPAKGPAKESDPNLPQG